MDVNKWCDRMIETYNDINEQQPDTIDDKQFVNELVRLLPLSTEWKVFYTQIKQDVEAGIDSGSPLTSDDVIERIREEEWNHQDRDPDHQAELLITTTQSLLRKRPNSDATANTAITEKHARYEDRPKLVCINEYCGSRKRHTKENCFAYGGGKAGKYPDWWKGKHNIHIHPDKHTKGNDNSKETAKKAEVHATHAIYLPRSSVDHKDPECSNVGLAEGPQDSSVVFSDSAANRHIVFDRALFTEYTPVNNIIIKGFDLEFSTHAAGIGTVEYIDMSGEGKLTVQLSDILHVPSACLNIWSCGELEDRGIAHYMDGRGNIAFTLETRIIATGRMGRNRLYRMHLKPTTEAGNGPVFMAASLSGRIGPDTANTIAMPSLANRIDDDQYQVDRMGNISLDEVDFPTTY